MSRCECPVVIVALLATHVELLHKGTKELTATSAFITATDTVAAARFGKHTGAKGRSGYPLLSHILTI